MPLPMRKNKFIAIEGLDGSGKSTQIDLLTHHFHAEGIDTRFVHFPRLHEGFFGEMISSFLRGEFGSAGEVHPKLVSLMFAEDRNDFAPQIREWMEQGIVVIVDRYVNSNLAFQCAKLKTDEEKNTLRNWILHLEYSYFKIPRPDFSMYLDVPFSFTEKALTRRLEEAHRNYLNGGEDIHEKDFSLQRAVKAEYENLLTTDPQMKRITCYSEDQTMRSREAIHASILACMQSEGM